MKAIERIHCCPKCQIACLCKQADGNNNSDCLHCQIIPICIGCNKKPDELDEYTGIAKEEDMTPDEYIRSREGTYNSKNGHFLCTHCYIEAGMPSSPQGWVAP